MAGIIKDGQVYTGYTSDDHINEVIKSNIASTIGSTSTKEELASAKDVYDKAIKDKNLKTYTSLSQLGLTEGSETLSDIATNMSNNSMAILNAQSSCNVSEYPVGYGVLTVNKLNINRVSFIFTETGGASTLRQWFASYNGGKLNGWKRVCTTSVVDIPFTDITSKLTNCSAGTIGYSVKDGICRVKINGLKPNTQAVEILATGILPNPDPIHNGHFNVMYTTGNMALFIIYNASTDGVRLHSCNSTISGDIYCTLEYPVKQS